MHKNIHTSPQVMQETIFPKKKKKKNLSSGSKTKIFSKSRSDLLRYNWDLKQSKKTEMSDTNKANIKTGFIRTITTKIMRIGKQKTSCLIASFDAEFTECKFCPAHKVKENKIFSEPPLRVISTTRLGESTAAPTKPPRK